MDNHVVPSPGSPSILDMAISSLKRKTKNVVLNFFDLIEHDSVRGLKKFKCNRCSQYPWIVDDNEEEADLGDLELHLRMSHPEETLMLMRTRDAKIADRLADIEKECAKLEREAKQVQDAAAKYCEYVNEKLENVYDIINSIKAELMY